MARKTFTDDERRHWAEQSLTRIDADVAVEAGVAAGTLGIWRRKYDLGPLKRGRPDVASSAEKLAAAESAQERIPRAWAAVDRALTGDGDPIAIKAAQIVFDRAWGKPFQDTRSTIRTDDATGPDETVAAIKLLAAARANGSGPG